MEESTIITNVCPNCDSKRISSWFEGGRTRLRCRNCKHNWSIGGKDKDVKGRRLNYSVSGNGAVIEYSGRIKTIEQLLQCFTYGMN